MKRFYLYNMNWLLSRRCLTGLLLAVSSLLHVYALDVSHYAANSRLADGRWFRIKVGDTGMHLVSAADLRAMGFNDIDKVNVYGTGGAMVREALSSDMPDDLPPLPCIKTSRGILFFGTDNVSWSFDADGKISHEQNPYCSESYYFLSDRDVPANEMRRADARSARGEWNSNAANWRLLHERDLASPGEAGRIMLGEDFRSSRSQTFNFTLPGYSAGPVDAYIRFGAHVSNGSSSLIISANGERLPSTSSDRIPGVSGEQFIVIGTTTKQMTPDAGRIAVTVDYSSSGALFTARLDYIRLEYRRSLDLGAESAVQFYDVFDGEEGIRIANAPADACVWDVTDPVSPARVECLREGADLYFVPAAGYREYMAFDPAVAGNAVVVVGAVANQDIHGMEEPDMVIVAYPEYMDAANSIARLHEETDGMKVAVVTPEHVYNEFSGGHEDVMAFRKMLKMWYDRDGERQIRYCLLMGRGSFDTRMVTDNVKNLGYRPLPMWQAPTGITEVTAYSTDDIIGMLEDCTEETFDIMRARICVAVGRLPVKNVREANEMAAKISGYVQNPVLGPWRNNVMLIADDGDNAIHLTQSEKVYSSLSERAPHFRYERLYIDSYPLEYTSVGKSYPVAKERMMRFWDDGVVLTNYVGHASSNSWTHEKLLTWSDIIGMSNRNLTFLYAATCLFGRWDALSVSGAEEMLLNPVAGLIGAIVPSRTVYMGPNGTLNAYTAEWILSAASDGGGTRVGDAFINGKNSYIDDNKLRYCLMSDPALRLPRPSMTLVVDRINGVDMSSADEFPEIPPLGKIHAEGRVVGPDGTDVSSFNGLVTFDVYDAECPVKTNGNGDGGRVETYNDRKARLSTVSARVSDGVWDVTIPLPAETSGNYSPARMVAYAYSEDGAEAHGSSENFYIYGYADDSDPDTEGPVIESFYLNFPEFSSGMTVNVNPVAHARFSDKSGINLSESGMGHKMSLILDKDKVFDDLSTFYVHDPENVGSGYITYPLSGIAPGKHTLTLAVYDNANNVSKATLEFNAGIAMDPVIRNLGTDVNPASVGVVFNVSVDRPNTDIGCLIEVFDLMGKRVWSDHRTIVSDMQGYMESSWNLCDASGRRVPRGIYLYRATVETPEGMYTSQSRKLAITAR